MRFPVVVLALTVSSSFLAACAEEGAALVDAGVPDAGPPAPELLVHDQQAFTRMAVSGDQLFFDVEDPDPSGIGPGEVVYRYEPGKIAPVRVNGASLRTYDFRVARDQLYFLDREPGVDGVALFRVATDALDGTPEHVASAFTLISNRFETSGDLVMYLCDDSLGFHVCVQGSFVDYKVPFSSSVYGSLAGDREGVFWTDADENGETIVFGPVTGTPHTIVDKQIGIDYLTLDQSYVYWASREHGYVRRALKDGLEPEVLATNQGDIVAFVASGDDLFWSVAHNDGSAHIVRLRAGASAPETVVSGVSRVFAVSADRIIFQDGQDILALPR